MATLIWIAPHLRAVLAPQVALQLMDRRHLGSPHDIESDGLIGFAAEALHFQIHVARVESVSERGRWLSRTLEGKHPLVPRFAGKPVGHLARLRRPLRRCPD